MERGPAGEEELSDDELAEEVGRLRGQVRRVFAQVKLAEAQIDGFRELDDIRRAISEHLIAERFALESANTVQATRAAHILMGLTEELTRLEEDVVDPDAAEDALGESWDYAIAKEQQRVLHLQETVDALERQLNGQRERGGGVPASTSLGAGSDRAIEAEVEETLRLRREQDALEEEERALREKLDHYRREIAKVGPSGDERALSRALARPDAEDTEEVTFQGVQAASSILPAPADNDPDRAGATGGGAVSGSGPSPEEAQFIARLRAGATIKPTRAFYNVVVIDPIDIKVSSLIERAQTLEEIRRLAPSGLKGSIEEQLGRYYAQGWISVVD